MKHLLVPVFTLLLLGCQKDHLRPAPETLELIHIAHTRTGDNAIFLDDLATIPFEKFAIRMLGGDLAAHTSNDVETMDSLDHFFNFSDYNTLWSLGNHDYDDLSLVQSFTGRPNFYSHHFKGITFLVLDTQEDYSKFTAPQVDLIRTVIDTLSNTSHLILLTHKLAWLQDDGELAAQINEIANGKAGDCFYCTNPNNFYQDVYPLLLEAKNKEVEIYCVAGDLGFKTSSFYHQTAEGIHFLASGLNGDDPNNQVILFDYNATDRLLQWEFVFLDQI